MSQKVFFFGDGHPEGSGDMQELLGVEGARLAADSAAGLPTPVGFTIASSEYFAYLKTGRYDDVLRIQVEGNLARLEIATGRQLGSPDDPLFLSVHTSSVDPQYVQAHNVTHIGLNSRTAKSLAHEPGVVRPSNWPDDPVTQLWTAVEMIWRRYSVPTVSHSSVGTAVIIMAMPSGT